MEKIITSTSTKGLVIGLIIIVISLVMYFMNIDTSSSLKWLPIILFCIAIFWSVNSFGKQINYNASFGNYFTHGFKTSAIVTLMMIAFVVISLFVFPEMKEKAMVESRKAMIEQKKLSDDQIESYIETTKKFYTAIAIGFTVFIYMFLGAIASLIGAAITKKDPNQFSIDINQISQ